MDGLGRSRAEVRGDAVLGADVHIAWLRAVVKGNKVWPQVDKEGNRMKRNPSGDEMLQAGEKLFKYGLGTKVETAREESFPQRPPVTDLSGLTREEKEMLLALAEKAEATAQQGNIK
jgi:hypothetical protein